MQLVSISATNVRGVPSGERHFTEPASGAPARVVVVTGPGGSGKTSFLEAIAALKELVAPYGPRPDAVALAAEPDKPGALAATFAFTEAEAKRARIAGATATVRAGVGASAGELTCEPGVAAVLRLHVRSNLAGKFEYVPAERQLVLDRALASESDEAFARPRLSRAPDKYRGILAALARRHVHELEALRDELMEKGAVVRGAREGETFGRLARAFAELAPDARLASMSLGDAGPVLRFVRRDGAKRDAAALCHGERQALLFAALFAYVNLDRSIVLVDAPELFLEPARQVPFLQALASLAQGVQLIVATSSVAIAGAAAPHELVRLPG